MKNSTPGFWLILNIGTHFVKQHSAKRSNKKFLIKANLSRKSSQFNENLYSNPNDSPPYKTKCTIQKYGFSRNFPPHIHRIKPAQIFWNSHSASD